MKNNKAELKKKIYKEARMLRATTQMITSIVNCDTVSIDLDIAVTTMLRTSRRLRNACDKYTEEDDE